MANRVEINELDLEEVVGGTLVWSKQGVYCKEDADKTMYSFSNYADCRTWIQNNWSQKPQNEEMLRQMEIAGLVHKQ